MEDIEYRFGATVLSPDIDMPDYIDVHDKYGIWVDSVLIHRMDVDRKESTILVEVTENDYQENFSDLIHRGEPFEWCFPTLEDKSHYITIRFVPEEEEL
jgi:hypothetical protein